MVNSIDKYKGCLTGLAIGDSLGAPFEFMSQKKIEKYLKTHDLSPIDYIIFGEKFPAGFYTDDTSMAICLAESLIEKEFDINDQFKRYKKWLFSGYATPFGKNSYGVGQQTFKALRKPIITAKEMNGLDLKAGGNGSLMRSAPIGLMYKNYQEIIDKSIISSYVTHNNYIASWSCATLNLVIRLILEGGTKESIPKKILTIYKDPPEEIKKVLCINNRKGNDYEGKISGYSLNTLEIALWSWQTTESYEASIKKVLLLGHDTDTFAAVTGAITGCFYGYNFLPRKWRDKLINKKYIVGLAEKLYSAYT